MGVLIYSGKAAQEEQFYILGARDPEMERIVGILTERGLPFVYATHDDRPVNGQTTYDAQAVWPANAQVVLVETNIPGFEPATRIDHHRPGDSGYDGTAREAVTASSLGQICLLLGIEMSHEDRVLAAMDHSFAAAVNGEVPDVRGEEVLALKIAEIARGTKLAEDQAQALVTHYRGSIKESPTINLAVGNQYQIADLRKEPLGIGYTPGYLCIQVAAVAEGRPILMTAQDAEDGPQKVMLTGLVNEDQVTEFKDGWAPAQGFVGIYGVPGRGYAGAYLPKQMQ